MSEEARIVVRVQPNARQNDVLGFTDGVIDLRIAAPPVKGRANQELIRFLSDVLGVSKSRLIIEKGLTSKRKLIVIKGLTRDQVVSELDKYRTNGASSKPHHADASG